MGVAEIVKSYNNLYDYTIIVGIYLVFYFYTLDSEGY